MNINEMRTKYAFWKCQDYAETRVLFRQLTVEEKGSVVQMIPKVLREISTINDVENIPDLSFEAKMCLKFAIRKVGVF